MCFFFLLLVENVYIKSGMKIVVHIMVNISNLVWCFSMDIYILYMRLTHFFPDIGTTF